MSDLVERLREWRGQESICTCMDLIGEAAAEIERLRADNERFVSHAEAITATLCADRDRLREALERELQELEYSVRGTTHWHGCESSHPRCAAVKRMRAALAGERKADHQHTNECWEPDSGCDMGRNEKHVVTGDRQSPQHDEVSNLWLKYPNGL